MGTIAAPKNTTNGDPRVVTGTQTIHGRGLDVVNADGMVFTDMVTDSGFDYVGFQSRAGVWEIKKMDSASMRIATISNNPTMTSYTLAWADVLTLTYSTVENL